MLFFLFRPDPKFDKNFLLNPRVSGKTLLKILFWKIFIKKKILFCTGYGIKGLSLKITKSYGLEKKNICMNKKKIALLFVKFFICFWLATQNFAKWFCLTKKKLSWNFMRLMNYWHWNENIQRLLTKFFIAGTNYSCFILFFFHFSHALMLFFGIMKKSGSKI